MSEPAVADQIGFVSILMPSLNEERHLAASIASVAPDPNEFDYEVIVLDGGSVDRTCEIVAGLAARDPRIRFVPNERRLQSAAINKGARVADSRAAIFVRADCHAIYPPGFVRTCVEALRTREAISVVVTMRTAGVKPFQKGVAAAQNSRLGNGGSAHRRPGPSRYIDHGHHAAFDRAAFIAAGGYDESLLANEDVELDSRLVARGGQIWLETSIPVTYYPRDTARALARQYFRYGKGRAVTFRRHRYRLKLRQLLPVAVLLLNTVALLLACFVSKLFLALPLAYGAACLLWSLTRAIEEREPAIAGSMALAAWIMHASWGCGFLAGLRTRMVVS